jgi:hypothetical protein
MPGERQKQPESSFFSFSETLGNPLAALIAAGRFTSGNAPTGSFQGDPAINGPGG